MASKKSAQQVVPDNQPSLFDTLSKELATPGGKPIQLQALSGDIGGELIAILSKGLYTNPLDCLREYAQNGVDARATTITLKITGNTAMIFDDGVGMGLAELLEAKKFGLSPKSIAQHVGFRGIGIYSGFDLCRQLLVTSKRAGSPIVHRMTFEFARMKAQLEIERNDPDAVRTSLVDLLTQHTTISRQEDDEVEEHFTTIELRDIQAEHIALLSDRRRLREYLLQNLPIAFDQSFKHGAVIEARLKEAVPGYNPIRVKLQLDGQLEEIVQKYGPTHKQLQEYAEDPERDQKPDPILNLALAAPMFREVRNTSGVMVGFYWACLNQARARLEPKEDKPQFEGFVYKVKGFSIGDRERLRGLFPRPQLYPWFTGEVYVVDPMVVPNAERNDFETSAAKSALELALLEDFRKALKPAAERFQAKAKAEEQIEKWSKQLDNLEKDYNLDTANERILEESDLERITEIGNIIDDLKSRKRAIGQDTVLLARVDTLSSQAKNLRKALSRLVVNPGGEIAKRKKAAERDGSSESTPTPPPPAPRTLNDLVSESAIDLNPQAARLIEIFQSALDDLLPSAGPEYRRFIVYLEEKLSDHSGLE